MSKYKKAWKKLRSIMEGELKAYKSGDMMSISEAIHGEKMCNEVLAHMDDIEYMLKISDDKPDKIDKKLKEDVVTKDDLEYLVKEYSTL